MRYVLEPSPGYDVDDLSVLGVDHRTAEINVIQNGIVVRKYPAFEPLQYVLGDELEYPPGLMKPDFLLARFRIIPQEKQLPSGYVAEGCDVWYQVIADVINEHIGGYASLQDIVDSIIRKHRYLPDTKEARRFIGDRRTGKVRQMWEEGFLLIDEGMFKTEGADNLPTGQNLRKLEDGQHPVILEIWRLVDGSYGDVTESDIIRHIMRYLKWVPESERIIAYIDYMERNNIIRRGPGGRFEALKRPEPWG